MTEPEASVMQRASPTSTTSATPISMEIMAIAITYFG